MGLGRKQITTINSNHEPYSTVSVTQLGQSVYTISHSGSFTHLSFTLKEQPLLLLSMITFTVPPAKYNHKIQ